MGHRRSTDGADDRGEPAFHALATASSSSGFPRSRWPRSVCSFCCARLGDRVTGTGRRVSRQSQRAWRLRATRLGPVLAGVTSTIFALCGAEIATIAAAESPDPAKVIARMTVSVMVRGGGVLRAGHRPDRDGGAVDFGDPRAFAVRHDAGRHGDPRRRDDHERGGARGGAVVPQQRALCHLTRTVSALPPW